jgi:hypothetical protein
MRQVAELGTEAIEVHGVVRVLEVAVQVADMVGGVGVEILQALRAEMAMQETVDRALAFSLPLAT